ncbi:hypothetical protein F9B85_04885 [Heliorestis acidaminivorans]|uniref:Uncharacterized protein n=1 Tax=Heliorestis acidaminivorans TaxID=553427 RepID=A0A6I0ERY3_9FIRM|nr:hypothetical protein [Heliorestis acidaminivorans]KAB2953250.1 hypothetical protein F9B85_04885 [Heliorestis acidaminivorans]
MGTKKGGKEDLPNPHWKRDAVDYVQGYYALYKYSNLLALASSIHYKPVHLIHLFLTYQLILDK